MKRFICALLAVLMVLPLAACGASKPAEEVKANTVVDLLGREINVPEQVDKIAAIAGPTYEMVFMLGAADKIVMVKSGHTDSYPLANLTNPNLKDMIGLSANPSSTVNIEDYLEQDIDRDIQEYPITELAQTVGIVYQDHTVSFPYTSLEVVRMGRAPYLNMFQTPSREDTLLAYEIMKELGIADIADKSYSKISGGQRQLVLIARTLCQQPDVILFDEPTSHLDFRNQAIVMKTLQKLSDQGMTIVMTSHFPSHAWQVGTKVVLMGRKGIIAQGTPEEIMTEDNLSDIYDVRVRIVNKQTEGSKAFFCEPCFD